MTQNDKKFMELCFQEARDSEHRGPEDPMVGAVVAKDGQLIGSTHRGQKSKGDHAEFTLLQKILQSKDLIEGATLYTTLEPCTTRSHSKKPCAEWIVYKGIRRVLIGILDPNPTICGRGYWHLVDNKIKVEFFPSRLAEKIMYLNEGFIRRHRGGADMTSTFAAAIQNIKGVAIAPYLGLGCSDVLSLQDCPHLSDGWPLAAVEMRINQKAQFKLPVRSQLPYRAYYKHNYDKKGFKDNGKKFMLEWNPISFSDAPSLALTVRPTRYSHVQFYRDTVAMIPSERDALIREFIEGSLHAEFPHSFCMHMVVVTSDKKILATRRSPKVAHDPETWSVSVEEQLRPEDFNDGSSQVISNWGSRLLKEELEIEQSAYHKDSLRLLSVFLEADILNVSTCAYTEVRINSQQLDKILRGLPRTDYEFTDWVFLDLDRANLLQEIFRPRRAYHRTSRYRLLLTFLKNFGMPTDSEVYDVTSNS